MSTTTPANRDHAESYVIGVDFGTLSGRALVVRVSDGAELGSAVHDYAHGVIDATLPASGAALPPEWALQVPADYVNVLKTAVPEAIAAAGIDPASVIGIATDFTASTPCRSLADGTPLCELPEFADRPHAYVEALEAPRRAGAGRPHQRPRPRARRVLAAALRRLHLQRVGVRQGPAAARGGPRALRPHRALDRGGRLDHLAALRPLPAQRVHRRLQGHLPGRRLPEPPTSSAALNPDFAGFADDKVAHEIGRLGAAAGTLTAEAAAWTGLPEGIAVAVGNVDAHVTAPAAQAVEPGQMLAIMGTSTCHVMNGEHLAEVPGMCGVVDGGIVDGLWGYEAGQSGVGDIFAWYVKNQVPARYEQDAAAAGKSIHQHLTDLAFEAAGRSPRPRRPRLGQRQPLGARQHRAERAASSARPSRPAPRRSTAHCWSRRRSAPG